MSKMDNKKALDEIKRITEQGSPFAETPVPQAPVQVLATPAQVKPVPEKLKIPKAPPVKDEEVIELSKQDFEALIEMAKKHDTQEIQQEQPTLGQHSAEHRQIESEKVAQTQPGQPQEVIHVNPQPNLGIGSMDYGGLTNRPTVLYFDTDRTCQLIQPKVNENGSVEIGERTFDFTSGQPSILNMGKWGRKQSHPFYIVKYSSMNPIDIAKDYPKTNPTPEQASRLIELGTLETLSKIPGGKVNKKILILLMIVAMVMGFVMCYMMSMFGVI